MAKVYWHQLPRLLRQADHSLVLVSQGCGLPLLWLQTPKQKMAIYRYGRGRVQPMAMDDLYAKLRGLGLRQIVWQQWVSQDEACGGPSLAKELLLKF